jgi:hypothetical protein
VEITTEDHLRRLAKSIDFMLAGRLSAKSIDFMLAGRLSTKSIDFMLAGRLSTKSIDFMHAGRLSAKNSYTAYHENRTNNLVSDIRSRTEGYGRQKDAQRKQRGV